MLALAAGATVALMFLLWAALARLVGEAGDAAFEHRWTWGVATSLVTASVVGWLAIRQRRRLEESLRKEAHASSEDFELARSLIEAVFEGTPAGLVVLDERCRVVRANSTARRVHGGELIGKSCHQAMTGREQPCAGCPAHACAAVPASSWTRQHTDSKTGEILRVEHHPIRIPGEGDYVLMIEDVVTERRKLEARVLHQEKMAAVGLLAAGIAHDMGNPLASMTAQLQLLDGDDLGCASPEVLSSLRGELGRLQRTLRELVEFARRRGDDADLVSVQDAVKDALRLLRHHPAMHLVRTEVMADPESPPAQMLEDHLVEVAMNLLGNSLDAMEGGGDLRVEIEPGSDDGVLMRITDDGGGMSSEVSARAFEPLYTTKVGEGTGLGLPVARDLVQAAGGDIELRSTPGEGTVATVHLPGVGAASHDQGMHATNGAPAACAGEPPCPGD